MSQTLTDRRVSDSSVGWERWALVALVVAQAALAMILPVAGPFSIDEVVYTEMTRSLTDGFGFFVDNGYEEVASPELATRFVAPTESGHLAAQYPPGLPLLAAPAYAGLGVRGIMLVNSLAFVAVVALTYLIARRLLHSRWIAGVSVAVLVAATYLWEYSIAIWPHMSTLAFGLASVLAMLVAVDGPRRRAAVYGFLSGLLLGLAVLNRLDAVLLLPVVAICLYRRTDWARASLSFVVGMIPPTLILSFSNWERWGTPLPFSYGGSITGWLGPIIVTGAGLVIVVAAVVFGVRRFRPSGRSIGFFTTALAALVIAVPVTRGLVSDTVAGVWTLLVDLRSYGATDEAALARLADGSLIYAGTVKKALLQSLPYLVLIALPLMLAWRTAQRRTALLLTTPIVLYIGFFAPRAWHGGLSFNLRYFLPVLPFAAIMTAWALRTLVDRTETDRDVGRLVRFSIVVTLALFALGRLALPSVEGSAWLFSVPPLAIAAATAVALSVMVLRTSRSATRVTLVLAVVGLTWASAVAFGYDAATTLNIRHSHAETADSIAELIEDGSLLVAGWPDNTYGVKDHRDDVVIALPANDDYATYDDVLGGFGPSRPVYGAMSPSSWADLPGSTDEWTEIGEVGTYSIRRLGAER